jgi:hypothetical protein
LVVGGIVVVVDDEQGVSPKPANTLAGMVLYPDSGVPAVAPIPQKPIFVGPMIS